MGILPAGQFLTREATVQLQKSDKIFVAGHRGMVGSALVRRFEAQGFTDLLTRDRTQIDLADESAIASFFAEVRPRHRGPGCGEGRGDKGKQ